MECHFVEGIRSEIWKNPRRQAAFISPEWSIPISDFSPISRGTTLWPGLSAVVAEQTHVYLRQRASILVASGVFK